MAQITIDYSQGDIRPDKDLQITGGIAVTSDPSNDSEIGSRAYNDERYTLSTLGDKIIKNQVLNAFRIAINGSLSVQNMVDGVVDEYEDETGIDGASSTNEVYDSDGDYYYNGSYGDVVMLHHLNGSDGSTDFSDEIGPHDMTAINDAQLDTAIKKFGSASLLFDGSGDCAQWDQHADFNFGTGDFTIDFWIYLSSVGTDYQGIIHMNAHYGLYLRTSYAKLNCLVSFNGTSWAVNQTSSNDVFSAETWHHVALVRNGSSWKIYVDGSEEISFTNSGSLAYTISKKNGLGLEASTAGSFTSGTAHPLNGSIDEFRISSAAEWTEEFTPESSEYSSGIGNMELISNSVTAETQPDQGRLVIFEEDVSVITVNTDLKGYVTRDGGTTWSQVTLSDEGDYDTNKRILTGTVDLSGQPSGTSMEYKITSHNTKALKIHGTGLLWD